MQQRRPHLLASAVVWLALAGCGPGDVDPPPYADPGHACPTVEERMPGLLSLLRERSLPGLERALDEGLGDQGTGRLVHVVIAALQAMDRERLEAFAAAGDAGDAGVGGLGPMLGELLEVIARSPDRDLFGTALGRFSRTCGAADLLRTVADLLAHPRLTAAIDAALAVAGDPVASELIRLRLFTGADQRDTFRVVGLQAVCLFRHTDADLSQLREVLRPFLGAGLDEPPLSTALDALLDLLAPASALRASVSAWSGCYVGVPPGPEAFACPFPLQEPAPDEELVMWAVVWDALASDALDLDGLTGLVGEGQAARATLVPMLGEVVRELADDDSAAEAAAEVVARIFSPPYIEGVLLDTAALLRAGAAGELIEAVGAVARRCPEDAP